MRNKRIIAMSMALLLALQSPLASMSVNATETDVQPNATEEYVVQVDNEKEFEEVTEDNKAAVVEDESVEELEDENMVVLELTAKEAAELEKDKNIVVEENILFTANTMESNEAVEEENISVTEESTEMITETSEEITTSETATEEDAEDSGSVEIVTEATDEATERVKEKKAKTSKKEDKDKNKKEKDDKKDKSKKDQKHEKQLAEKRAKIESKKHKNSSEADQWNLDAIRYADSMESKDTIKVALLDSGVSFDEDIPIVERITINENNEVENVLFDDATGHGTSMAGMIGAQDNGAGIKGINPDAEIYSIQILDENNQSTLGQVIAGIHKAIELDCDIINMSFGTTVDSQLLHDAIKEADKNGILMIAAAGNTEGGAVEYPAAYDEVLAVGASDTTGNKLDGSSDGEEIEIFAPGDQVVSTGLFGGSIVLSGTSIAVAQVTVGCYHSFPEVTSEHIKLMEKASRLSDSAAYKDTKELCISCEVLFDESYNYFEYDGINIFYPTKKYVKLNNFRGYAREQKQDLSMLTSEEWAAKSTPTEY